MGEKTPLHDAPTPRVRSKKGRGSLQVDSSFRPNRCCPHPTTLQLLGNRQASPSARFSNPAETALATSPVATSLHHRALSTAVPARCSTGDGIWLSGTSWECDHRGCPSDEYNTATIILVGVGGWGRPVHLGLCPQGEGGSRFPIVYELSNC